MPKRIPTRPLPALAATLLLAAGASQATAADNDDRALLQQAQKLFKPLPKDMGTRENPVTPARVALGRALFFDPRISVDGTVSCAKCHKPQLYGTDGLAKAIGNHAKVNPRNSPTILNAALQGVVSAHWRGDRKSVEDQATKSLIGPPSFGLPNNEAAVARLKAIPGYQPMFKAAFPNDADPYSVDNWGTAIGAYERTLVTPGPFDAFLRGDTRALSPTAKAGLRDFISVGCASCHNGPGLGGTSYQKFGVHQNYWSATGSKEVDKGRFDVTKDEKDLYVFKVPILRNVAMTPPYFHDGSVATLPAAVRIMAKVQLNKTLSDAQAHNIVAFLDSLTGPLPKNFATVPVLPSAAFRER
ncbi:cytochrome c peroxidase [Thermithiobacillus tepidarius DSM 3134]|uniref:cytochrome-c peroxidase n=1 Tax=Thermithiobacillus tepidarius TaxID=929 RepID=UPI00041AD071|nr:cytochrome c peroxidase [Thermithiobacillus tepidarius]